jgi:hypothetical protein
MIITSNMGFPSFFFLLSDSETGDQLGGEESLLSARGERTMAADERQSLSWSYTSCDYVRIGASKMFAFAHILLSTPTAWPCLGCFDHAVSIMELRS